jgi:hypothetical protein
MYKQIGTEVFTLQRKGSSCVKVNSLHFSQLQPLRSDQRHSLHLWSCSSLAVPQWLQAHVTEWPRVWPKHGPRTAQPNLEAKQPPKVLTVSFPLNGTLSYGLGAPETLLHSHFCTARQFSAISDRLCVPICCSCQSLLLMLMLPAVMPMRIGCLNP